MPNGLRLYLDQMFGLDVAAGLRREVQWEGRS
jgi:hypothetical protein